MSEDHLQSEQKPQRQQKKRSKPEKKYYQRRDPAEFTASFYERFDEMFTYNQAVTLKHAIDQGEPYRSSLNAHLATMGLEPVSEKYFASLRAEFFFMVLHQCEALFALLRAPFSGTPDWIYLSAYKTEEIKDIIESFALGIVRPITNGMTDDMHKFLVWAIFAGFRPTNDDERPEFEANLERIEWCLRRMAHAYAENLPAYNSYKHGLRVITGDTWFRLRPNDAEGNPSGAGLSHASPDSLIFLELETKPKDEATTVYETIVHFDPDEYFFYLTVIATLFENIKTCRLAKIKNQVPEKGVHIYTALNTDELAGKWAKRQFRWSISQ